MLYLRTSGCSVISSYAILISAFECCRFCNAIISFGLRFADVFLCFISFLFDSRMLWNLGWSFMVWSSYETCRRLSKNHIHINKKHTYNRDNEIILKQLTLIWNTKLPPCSEWIAEYPFLPALVKLAALTVRLSLGYLCPSSSFLALLAIIFCISVRYATNYHKQYIDTMYLVIFQCISNYFLIISCRTY